MMLSNWHQDGIRVRKALSPANRRLLQRCGVRRYLKIRPLKLFFLGRRDVPDVQHVFNSQFQQTTMNLISIAVTLNTSSIAQNVRQHFEGLQFNQQRIWSRSSTMLSLRAVTMLYRPLLRLAARMIQPLVTKSVSFLRERPAAAYRQLKPFYPEQAGKSRHREQADTALVPQSRTDDVVLALPSLPQIQQSENKTSPAPQFTTRELKNVYRFLHRRAIEHAEKITVSHSRSDDMRPVRRRNAHASRGAYRSYGLKTRTFAQHDFQRRTTTELRRTNVRYRESQIHVERRIQPVDVVYQKKHEVAQRAVPLVRQPVERPAAAVDVNQISDDVMRKIKKQIFIERERRGLL